MTDLEMTRLCAEAMGFSNAPESYDPLSDDGQALRLVVGLRLTVQPVGSNWYVNGEEPLTTHSHLDLNRAIVECVARMQAAKPDARKAAETTPPSK